MAEENSTKNKAELLKQVGKKFNENWRSISQENKKLVWQDF